MNGDDSNDDVAQTPTASIPLPVEYDQLQRLINDAPGVEALISLHTLQLDDGLLVGAKISFPPGSSVERIAHSLGAIERDICNAVPQAKAIYLQPDLYVDTPEFAPSTDHIVIQSGN